jgi:hypothetical protein
VCQTQHNLHSAHQARSCDRRYASIPERTAFLSGCLSCHLPLYDMPKALEHGSLCAPDPLQRALDWRISHSLLPCRLRFTPRNNNFLARTLPAVGSFRTSIARSECAQSQRCCVTRRRVRFLAQYAKQQPGHPISGLRVVFDLYGADLLSRICKLFGHLGDPLTKLLEKHTSTRASSKTRISLSDIDTN